MRVMIFVDFWNFQLNWNERVVEYRCDWFGLPKYLMRQVREIFRDMNMYENVLFQGVRIYASVNPESDPENRLRKFLMTTLNQQPGFSVNATELRSRRKPVVCSNCKHIVEYCPNCSQPYHVASEKGVDAAIITDMFALYFDNVYDTAVVVSADSDLVPMVTYLQNHRVKIINAAWRNHGIELRQSCWSSFEIDSITHRMILHLPSQ